MIRLMTQNRTVPNDVWVPQRKQRLLLKMCGLDLALTGGEVYEAMAPIIGYGGAAGGGKTEGMLAAGLIACHQIPGVKVGFFRRTYKELEDLDGPIERSHALFPKLGAFYNKTEHVWRFGKDRMGEDWNEAEGSAFKFCHCQHEKDKQAYQSAAFDILLFDEATHFTWTIINFLLLRNRVSRHSEIPRPFTVMGSNPGGVGHAWYKRIFGIQDNIDQKHRVELIKKES